MENHANTVRTPTAVCPCSQTIRDGSLYSFNAMTFTQKGQKWRKRLQDLGLRGLGSTGVALLAPTFLTPQIAWTQKVLNGCMCVHFLNRNVALYEPKQSFHSVLANTGFQVLAVHYNQTLQCSSKLYRPAY